MNRKGMGLEMVLRSGGGGYRVRPLVDKRGNEREGWDTGQRKEGGIFILYGRYFGKQVRDHTHTHTQGEGVSVCVHIFISTHIHTHIDQHSFFNNIL